MLARTNNVAAAAGFLPGVRQYISSREKIPCDLHGNHVAVTAVAHWTTLDDALGRPWETSFVFGNGYVGLDLDKCYDPITGQWSELAQQMCALLHGAYVEVSRSGTGLHFIFKGTVPEGHRCRWKGVELYSKGRHFVLTGNGARGSGDWDGSAVIPSILELAPTKTKKVEYPSGERDEGWKGPENDDELIRLVAESGAKTPQHMFEGRATCADVWHMRADVLARTWPGSSAGGFDHSAVDAALMWHLSYFTGRDVPRMERVFQQWQGYRDKYESRGELMGWLLSGGCGNPRVYNNPKYTPPPPPPMPSNDGLVGYYPGFGIPEDEPELIQRVVPLTRPGMLLGLLGQSGGGKTFLATSLALSHASGIDFMGFKVRERVGVIILAAEGAGTIDPRLWAGRQFHRIDGPLAIRVIPGWPNLLDDASRLAFITEVNRIGTDMIAKGWCSRLGVIQIDTVSAAFHIDDENDSMSVRNAGRCMVEIGEKTGTVIEAVHHHGKNVAAGARGSSAWRDMFDHAISVVVDRDEKTNEVTARYLSISKSRVGDEGPLFEVEIVNVAMGKNRYDEDRSSGVIVKKGHRPASRKRDLFHEIYDDVFRKRQRTIDNHVGADREEMRVEFMSRYPGEHDACKKAWQRALKYNVEERRGYDHRDGVIWTVQKRSGHDMFGSRDTVKQNVPEYVPSVGTSGLAMSPPNVPSIREVKHDG